MTTTTTRTTGNADRLRNAIEAYVGGDVDAYVNHFAEDARLIGPYFPEPLVGREAIEEISVSMANAFPNFRWDIVTLLEDGNRVVCELHIEARNDGPLPTPDGLLPATGRTISFDVLEILEFNEEGLVVEQREYMDPTVMMTQLGLAE